MQRTVHRISWPARLVLHLVLLLVLLAIASAAAPIGHRKTIFPKFTSRRVHKHVMPLLPASDNRPAVAKRNKIQPPLRRRSLPKRESCSSTQKRCASLALTDIFALATANNGVIIEPQLMPSKGGKHLRSVFEETLAELSDQ